MYESRGATGVSRFCSNSSVHPRRQKEVNVMKMSIFKSRLNFLITGLLVATVVAFGFGCSEDLGVKTDNQPPTVWLQLWNSQKELSSCTNVRS